LDLTVASRADVLVTANIKDFQVPPGSFSVDIQHPDTFLCHQLELAPRDFFMHSKTWHRKDMNP